MRYLHVEPNSKLNPYDGARPFRAVVIIEDAVTPDWQASTSKWLVDSGCLYMLAWGKDCSSWDDAVDLVNIERFGSADIPDEAFVVTTWHESEELPEVFASAKQFANASSDKVEIVETILFHISWIDRGQEYSELFESS